MVNDDVVALAGAGLSDDIIVAKIYAAPTTAFDTSLAGLKALKAAGVSPAVIKVMIAPVAPSNSVAVPAKATVNLDDPMSVHAPGIYVLTKGPDGQTHLTKLTHIVPKQAKTNGFIAMQLTYGIAKAKTKVYVDGKQSSLELKDPNPTFYAYIPEDNSTFGGSPISIEDFSLIKLEVHGNTRAAVVGSLSPWTGVAVGTDAKTTKGFSNELVKPGIYKMTLLKPLPSGEYAFQQAGASGSSADQKNTGSYFDFGVLPDNEE